MENKFSPPRLIFKVYANETLEQAEQLAMQHELPLRECISHTDFHPAFNLVQTTSVNENLGEEGIGEWSIKDASDWACKNLNHSFGIGINAIWDEDKRYTTSYMFRLIRYLLDNPNEFRVNQDIIVYNEESFTKWSDENLEDYDNDPPQDDKNDNHVREYNLNQIEQEHEQDLTTSLGDLLDEATEDKPDYSFFSDMTPEQIGKKGWTWEVGKGLVRKPKPCCPQCHQELWWE